MRELLRKGLKRLVDQKPRTRARGNREAMVVAVASLKGGVGKTTTSVHLASALARFHDKKVLLVDLDPQGHVGRCLAKVSARDDATTPVLSTVLTAERPGEVLDVAYETEVPGLFVTPRDPGLRDAESLLSTKLGKELLLREALTVTRTHFDVIILDCPPNLGNLTANALVACDRVLVPCDLSPLAIEGVQGLLEASAQISERLNPQLDLLGIVITRFDARTASLNQAMLDELEATWEEALVPVRIGVNTSLSRSQHEGRDVFAHAPRSRGAEHYEALAKDVARRLWGRRSG